MLKKLQIFISCGRQRFGTLLGGIMGAIKFLIAPKRIKLHSLEQATIRSSPLSLPLPGVREHLSGLYYSQTA